MAAPSVPRSFPSAFTAADRLMWHIERDPVLRSPIVVVGILDREASWDKVLRTMERAAAAVPRLRQVVRGATAGDGRLRWEDDPSFRLSAHVRHLRAPNPAEIREVLDVAAVDAAAPFDPARPLWDLAVIDGVEGGRGAFILRFHHTITDGIGGIDLAASVFDADRRGRSVDVAKSPGVPPRPADDAVARVGALAHAGIDAALHPARALEDATRVARSVARMLEPAPEPLSPVLVGRSIHRHLDVLEVPLRAMIDTAHALDATVNEVFLAAAAGGLHDYHRRLGHHTPALRITMPISVRRPDDPPGGNRFTPARFTLPVDDPDPVSRVMIVRSLVERWRHEPAVGLTDVLAGVLDLLPAPVVTSVFGSMLKNVDVDAVDVPGFDAPAYLGGSRIDRIWAFAPPTGAALSVTLLSHVDTACVGVLADLAAVSDPTLLRTCLGAALDEMLSIDRLRSGQR